MVKRSAVLTIAIILSASSLGYLGIAFGTVLLLSGRIKHFVAVPVVVGGLLILAYIASPFFRSRVDDMVVAISSQDVTGSNSSTYALISNAVCHFSGTQRESHHRKRIWDRIPFPMRVS